MPVPIALLVTVVLISAAYAFVITISAPKTTREKFAGCKKRTVGTIRFTDLHSLKEATGSRKWRRASQTNSKASSDDVLVHYKYAVDDVEYTGCGMAPYGKGARADMSKREIGISLYYNEYDPAVSCTAYERNKIGYALFWKTMLMLSIVAIIMATIIFYITR